MRILLSKRIPIAWFLLAVIFLAAVGILWLIASKGTTTSNAVLIYSATDADSPATTSVPTQAANLIPTPQALVVYVSGEVVTPGVYTLPLGSRVADAVAASGGFTDKANREGINLAARVGDEQHISVPRLGETTGAQVSNTPGGTSEAGGITTGEPTAVVAAPGKININTASAGQLVELPGIGEVLAQRIITEREANGPFKSVDDLVRVPGIKEGIIAQLRDFATVGP
jgi:competence protein ComEA